MGELQRKIRYFFVFFLLLGPIQGAVADGSNGDQASNCREAITALTLDPDYEGEAHRWFGLRGVQYLRTERQRQPYEASIRNGLVVDRHGNPFTSSLPWRSRISHRFYVMLGLDLLDNIASIFVLTSDGRLFLGPDQQVGRFHHSSFLAGKPVACAGVMSVVNGRIRFISDRSGHYKPGSVHMARFYQWLIEHGIDLSLIEGVPGDWRETIVP